MHLLVIKNTANSTIYTIHTILQTFSGIAFNGIAFNGIISKVLFR